MRFSHLIQAYVLAWIILKDVISILKENSLNSNGQYIDVVKFMVTIIFTLDLDHKCRHQTRLGATWCCVDIGRIRHVGRMKAV